MFKAIFLLKRKPGITMEAFRDYYEAHHSKFVQYMPGVRRYIRHYVLPLNSGIVPGAVEAPYDVVMELWLDDRAAFDAAFSAVVDAGRHPEVVADEEKLFDRASMVGLSVLEEWETDLLTMQSQPAA